jgi:hypothetical protein
VAYSRSRAEFSLNRDGSAATGTRILRELRQWSSALIAQAPKLKAFCVDCFLDRIARQVVGRSFVRCYCPGSSPGTVLARKFVHVRVAGESAQPVRSLRFENVDAHGDLISRKRSEFEGRQCVNVYQRIGGAKRQSFLNRSFIVVTENRDGLKDESSTEPPIVRGCAVLKDVPGSNSSVT